MGLCLAKFKLAGGNGLGTGFEMVSLLYKHGCMSWHKSARRNGSGVSHNKQRMRQFK